MHYWLLLVSGIIGLVGSSGQLQMTNEEIENFATIMESEIPGSVDYLTQWAFDEVTLDNFENILAGRTSPPRTARFRGEMCMYILSTNPRIEPQAIVARLERIGLTASLAEISELVAVARAPTRIPAWLYNIFATSQAQPDSSWRTVYPEMERNINYFKRRGWIVNTDRRFKGGARRWYTIYFLWHYFCMNNPATSVTFDPATNEWVMSEETQQAVFRYTAISMNRGNEGL